MRLATLALVVALAACGGSEGADETDSADAADMTAADNTLTAEEEAAGWTLLFDGTSTDGWRRYGADDMPETWVPSNGDLVLITSGGDMDGGDIITRAEYTDFELAFDFKVGPQGNSGVFYRVREADGKGLWQVAAEYQVLDDPAYFVEDPEAAATHLTGDNYDLQSAGERPLNPTGEWNTGRIVVDGNRVEHWLNGAVTLEFEMYTDEWEALVAASKFGVEEHYARASSGSIGLQDHGTPVWYRNMKIRRLNEN